MANASRPRPPKQGRRDFPVGIPVQPPPGWRPMTTGSAQSTFRAQFGVVVQAMLLGLMVFVCTTVGWLWVKAPRRARPGERVEVKAPAQVRNKDFVPPRAPAPAESALAPAPPARITVEAPRPRREPERPTPPPPTRVLTYEKDILPIVQRACISCHGATRKRGGLDLRTFASLARGGESGVGVQPGKPDESALLESVVSGRMPPGKMKLPPAEKQLIRDWIASGAKSTKGR